MYEIKNVKKGGFPTEGGLERIFWTRCGVGGTPPPKSAFGLHFRAEKMQSVLQGVKWPPSKNTILGSSRLLDYVCAEFWKKCGSPPPGGWSVGGDIPTFFQKKLRA